MAHEYNGSTSPTGPWIVHYRSSTNRWAVTVPSFNLPCGAVRPRKGRPIGVPPPPLRDGGNGTPPPWGPEARTRSRINSATDTAVCHHMLPCDHCGRVCALPRALPSSAPWAALCMLHRAHQLKARNPSYPSSTRISSM